MDGGGKRIMHLDMDAFFASVEQADDPELRGKPVIVGGDKRGVVSAASYEARAFGVRSAMPVFQARQLCPEGVFVRGRMRRYAEVSAQVMAILADVSPRMEPASIDEAYVDIGPEPSGEIVSKRCLAIKATIRERTGLGCSIGVAPVRFAAKIASDFRKPDGLTIVEADGLLEFLHPLPVGKIPGVGAKTLETLELLGVKRIGDVLGYPRAFWAERFGERGDWLYDRALGVGNAEVARQGEGREAKSTSAEHTLDEPTQDMETLSAWLLRLAERVGAEARRDGHAGRTVVLKLKYADFQSISRHKTLAAPTDATMPLWRAAVALLKAERINRPVRLIGVGLTQFGPVQEQLSMLPRKDAERERRLDAALDAARGKYGAKAIRRASTLSLDS